MILAFGDIEVDTGRGEVRRCGETVHTGPRVLNLLYLLASNADRLITKEEIVDKVWDGRAVSDSAISTVVKEARKATGDDGARQEVIRTLHGVRFRCVAPVRIRAPAAPHQGQPCEAVTRTLPGANLRFSGKPSIAVLPFLDERPEAATHHLGDAIPAELIAALSRLRWLSVTARGSAFRFREHDPGLVTVSQVLGVRYCLSGIVEIYGKSIAATVELSRTVDGVVIWSDRLTAPLDEVDVIRSRIVASVTAALELHVPLSEAERRNGQLRKTWMRGRNFTSDYSISTDSTPRQRSC